MRNYPNLAFSILVLLASCSPGEGNAQTQDVTNKPRVGGPCEGCEAMYENKTDFTKLSWQLTLPGYDQRGPKLHLTGVVYKADGKTPAPGIILYFYHTDQTGVYPVGNETGWGRRHGYIRGWLRTNEKGEYSLRTLKPAGYPNRGAAAHIHCIVKEDNLNEYYVGDFLFEDDPLLSSEEKANTHVPGGNGVLKLQQKDGFLYAQRDIYLGRNVRSYPAGG